VPHAKEVTLQADGKDMYGRTIADVLLPDGTNVNHTLVKDAWCWGYRKYALGIQCWKAQSHRRSPASTTDWDAPPVVTA